MDYLTKIVAMLTMFVACATVKKPELYWVAPMTMVTYILVAIQHVFGNRDDEP